MIVVIETSKRAESGSDKSNKHHKYTLDEALPVRVWWQKQLLRFVWLNPNLLRIVNPVTATTYNLLLEKETGC